MEDALPSGVARVSLRRRLAPLWPWLIAMVALALPFAVDSFSLFQLTMVLIYAIAILGLNVLTGISGQFSLGHGAFFALGAYATAILLEAGAMPYLLTIPAAAILCLVAGYLIGLPALRLKSVHLALATFALAIAIPEIVKLSIFEHVTGGVHGILVGVPPVPPVLKQAIGVDQWLYFLTLGIGFGLYLMSCNLADSRTGRALKALRENEVAAASMGVATSRYKAVAFAISAMITGIAGSLCALVVQFVAPDSFPFQLSIALLVGLVIGGIGSLPGALAGGVFVVFVPNIAESVSKGLAGAIYGLLLIAIIFSNRNALGRH
ncbi:branched-chain amino acid ABC transporter permease [Sphingopyxis sp.]|uniref:branched-chain amino acid ABC transporter permease n=1 Tax=Sphingopyxis sp. TaxID=1908224 RepID=UPI002DF65129|nr:branched-chain amino acid ABC transporter permease [Sphingopyxis sp.]